MQISIIIPIYKVEKYIERCIKSVIVQTFTDYEIILVDDASPDNALQLAENLLAENKIAFQTIKHLKNQGLSAARNSGFEASKGNYIYFLDSDDELAHKNALQILHSEILRGNHDFVTAKEQHIENGKEKFSLSLNGNVEVLSGTDILIALSNNNITATAWNFLIQKDFILKNKLSFVKGRYFEDILYSFSLCTLAVQAAIIQKITYLYYSKENSNAITSTLNAKKIDDAVFMCNEMLDFAKKNNLDKKLKPTPIYHILRLAMLWTLSHPSLIKNKREWKRAYLLFRTMYRKSFLAKWKNKLFLPPGMAYFMLKYFYKDYGFRGQGLILRPLRKIAQLNF